MRGGAEDDAIASKVTMAGHRRMGFRMGWTPQGRALNGKVVRLCKRRWIDTTYLLGPCTSDKVMSGSVLRLRFGELDQEERRLVKVVKLLERENDVRGGWVELDKSRSKLTSIARE